MDISESQSDSTKLPRRRNGKEQACEPCRKAKMRCDHTLPICHNCRRRNITEKCIYVEAPQTRPKTQTQRSGSRVLPQPQFNAFAQPTSFEQTSEGISQSYQEPDLEDDPSRFRISSGFYGPTSFSAVYENVLGPNINSPQDQSPYPVSPENDRTEEQLSTRVSLGIKILNQLPNQATCDRIMDIYVRKGLEWGFHKPTIIHCMTSLWTHFGQALRQPRKSKDLREIAQMLSRNTLTVLREAEDPDIWLASLSGRNLRWEMIGIIFCILGKVMLVLPEDDPFWASQSGRRMQRRDFTLEMKECADECIKLSNQMDNINMLLVILLHKRNILESQCTGDTSLTLWRQHGDLNNAATGLGLHRDRDPSMIPSISSEMRRRIWAVTFGIDKTLAAFTGRPPGISHRYNCCPLPLDLSDEILLAPKEERERAMNLLDANGWNASGEWFPATSARAVMIISLILSEILEISLGAESQYSDERLIDLKFRINQAYNFFPPWLHLSSEPPDSNTLQWVRFTLRLRYLHCSLLLEQLSIKRAHANHQPLLDIAREMLELTVYMWVERDRFIERAYDYDWMIMCYGIPSSGVICVELLKQLKQPRNIHLRLPRSEVIQNLSLLIGFLEWVRPTAANSELCGKMGVIIKHILDQVLDPAPVLHGLETSPVSLPAPELEFGPLDSVEFDWLGSVDWTQGPFLDLGGDTFHQF